MTYFIIILIILVIFVFNNLNNRIRILEKEIAELHRKAPEKIPDQPDEIQDTSIVLQNREAEKIPVSTGPEIPGNEISEKQQKDWLTPVFEFLKQNALTIIGIFTLVLGVGYFVKYAIDKNWIGETPRVGIGFLTGGIIIAAGHFLRKNYAAFASIITGGGIAVLYFTITIAFREYQLFSQTAAFSVTCLITFICIALSYYYKSEILNIFALFGGFLAPFMISTGESNYLFLFTYLTVLNIGMLTVVFLKNWKSVGWISFIFTGAYLSYWTAEKTEMQSIFFYIINYIIFYLFALQNYFKKNMLSSTDILMLVLINFTSIIGLVYIFNVLEYEPVIIFPVIFALVNLGLLYREYSQKIFGIHYSVFAGITVSLFTVAVALQFKTHLITSVWAVETTLLLFIWKKTGHHIFRICFYMLFPLVIISQMVTWTEYINTQNLTVIFNPVFLTTSVTVITAFLNMMLWRKIPDDKNENNGFFGNIFSVISYGIMYLAFLLEILYHISEKPQIVILSIAVLYSVYFIFFVLFFRKKLDINKAFETGLLCLFFALIIFNASICGTGLISEYAIGKTGLGIYGLYFLYWLPFMMILFSNPLKSDFLTLKFSYWLVSLAIITAVSCELYDLYVLINTDKISGTAAFGKHFSLLYLPIIWAILASLFLYKGLKSDIPEYSKIGFALIAVMILKLYAYDVWKMDNISKIVAFIILGLILLLSSFLFQRVKRIIKNMVENKDENPDRENIKMQ